MMLPKADVGHKRSRGGRSCHGCRWWGKVLATNELKGSEYDGYDDLVPSLGRCTNLYNIALKGSKPIITGPFTTCGQFEASEA